MTQTLGHMPDVASSVYRRKGKALYTPILPGEGEAASLASGSSCGAWRPVQGILSHGMVAVARASLGTVTTACSESCFSSVEASKGLLAPRLFEVGLISPHTRFLTRIQPVPQFSKVFHC